MTAPTIVHADQSATDAARAAGVVIRAISAVDDAVVAADLLAAVWRLEPGRRQFDPGFAVALAHTGNYATAAFRDDRMVAASVGFFHDPDRRTLHSHITGVLPDEAGTGVGNALKMHQRAWCLARGIEAVTWTFDPLIARNAHFNIARLGATATEYLPDFYGAMDDGINIGQPSDRMLVRWDLLAVRTPADTGDVPAALVVEHDAPRRQPRAAGRSPRCRVEIPRDIEAVRESDPGNAAAWRLALREVLTGLLADGWRITGFDRDRGYLLER